MPQSGYKEFDEAISELRTQVLKELPKMKTFAEVIESYEKHFINFMINQQAKMRAAEEEGFSNCD